MASLADDTIHKQSFSIDDLATRSVTIYPTRAVVVRDIENVDIQPGRNEITLHNLTPQADEHSIKVEGHGTNAVITDMTVDLIPNYRFTTGSTDSDSESEPDEESPKNPTLEQLKQDIKILRLQIEDADESRSSAMKQLAYLEQLTNNLSLASSNSGATAPIGSVADMSENLKCYSADREKLYRTFKDSQGTFAKLTEELNEKVAKELKLQAAWDKSCRKADRLKEQRVRQRTHEHRERQEQQLEVPRFVYRIKITVESESLPVETRAIVATVATGKPARVDDDEPPSGSDGPSLRISYVTGGASWTPRYDLRLDTTSGTGVLTYRAHFFNRTGEIWRNAQLTLSTSQASFSGLEDKVPWMDSWRVALRKRGVHSERDGAMYSVKEKELKEEKAKKLKEDNLYFTPGYEPQSPTYSPSSPPPPPPPPPVMHMFGQARPELRQRCQASMMGARAAAEAPGADIMTGASSSPMKKKRMSWAVTSASRSAILAPGGSSTGGGGDDPYSSDEDDVATLNQPQKMSLAASSTESYGLTTTYDLPGLRTIPPSKLLRRHVITEINLPHVEFYHISVPKLRAVAFLKARIRNPSNTPLLQGPAGLTLDGSFLGNSTVPRCAPDEKFELSLGIDEEVLIEYRKPVRRMASQGMLVKEQVATYERCVRVHNARGNLVKLVVFDQVPVSEDERLRVAISKPRGLRNSGDVVKVPGSGESFLNNAIVTGTGKQLNANRAAGKDYVQAEMRKGGEIRWEVSIEGGKDAILPLEYEARLPSGEAIVGI